MYKRGEILTALRAVRAGKEVRWPGEGTLPSALPGATVGAATTQGEGEVVPEEVARSAEACLLEVMEEHGRMTTAPATDADTA